MSNLQKELNRQKKITVEWKDNEGKKHSKKITVQNPGTKIALDILNDFKSAGDVTAMGNAYEKVMKHTLVNPKLNFADLNKELPEDKQEKIITRKNADGEDVTFKFKFPGYRFALNLISGFQKNDDSARFTQTMDMLNKHVIFNEKDKHVDFDFWDNEANGLAMFAFNEANNFLSDILDRDGFMSILAEALTFSTKQVSIIE